MFYLQLNKYSVIIEVGVSVFPGVFLKLYILVRDEFWYHCCHVTY